MSWRSGRTVLMVLLIVSVMVSCTLFSSENEGALVISYGGMGRVVWEPDADDMKIASYQITLEGPGSFSVFTVHNTGGDGGGSYVFDGLRAGEYILEIEGYNQEDAQGDKIAVLTQRDDDGTLVRNIAATVRRSQISAVDAVLVPHVDDTFGSLEITEVLFRGADDGEFDKRLMQNNPKITLELHHLGSADLNVQDGSSYLYALVDEGKSELSVERSEDGNDVRFVHSFSSNSDQGPEDIGGESSPALTVTNLPSGWYRMTVELQSDDDVRIWKRAVLARVLDITDGEEVKPTRGVLTVRDFMLEAGGIDLDISHDMEPLAVEISGPDTVALGDDDSSTETFTAEGSFSNPSYLWYVNGDYVGDAETFEYEFTESGSFCVTVMVHDGGRWGAASITAEVHQYVVGKPGQGGIVFYDKGFYGEDSWRYLEVSVEEVSDSADWNSAVALCASYEGAGFDDWFLPTKDELFAVYEQLHLQDIGDFAEAYYWSLDELNDGFAWSQSFITGGFQVSTGDPIVNNQFSFSKDSTRRVRAVRAF